MDTTIKLCMDGICTGARRGAQGLLLKSLKIMWIQDKQELLHQLPYVALHESWPMFEAAFKVSRKAKKALAAGDHSGALESVVDFLEQLTMRLKDREAYALSRLANGSWYEYQNGAQQLAKQQWTLAKYAVAEGAEPFMKKVAGTRKEIHSREFLDALVSYVKEADSEEAKLMVCMAAAKVVTERKVTIVPIYREKFWNWEKGTVPAPQRPPYTVVSPFSKTGMKISGEVASNMNIPTSKVLFTWAGRYDMQVMPTANDYWMGKYLAEASKRAVTADSRQLILVRVSNASSAEADKVLGPLWY